MFYVFAFLVGWSYIWLNITLLFSCILHCVGLMMHQNMVKYNGFAYALSISVISVQSK